MGAEAVGGWPQLDLWVNSVNVTSWTVTGAWQTYTANVTLTGQDHVDLVFANDAFDATTDRNLSIASLQVDSQPTLAPTAAVYDRRVGAAAFDGQDVIPGQALMAWNGALRFVLNNMVPYAYDANGNLINRAGQTLTWDVENHLQRVTGLGWTSATTNKKRRHSVAAFYRFSIIVTASPPLIHRWHRQHGRLDCIAQDFFQGHHMRTDLAEGKFFAVAIPRAAIIGDRMIGVLAVEFNRKFIDMQAFVPFLGILPGFDNPTRRRMQGRRCGDGRFDRIAHNFFNRHHVGADATEGKFFTSAIPLTFFVTNQMIAILTMQFNFTTMDLNALITFLGILTCFHNSARCGIHLIVLS